jgi:hypothetical protein
LTLIGQRWLEKIGTNRVNVGRSQQMKHRNAKKTTIQKTHRVATVGFYFSIFSCLAPAWD